MNITLEEFLLITALTGTIIAVGWFVISAIMCAFRARRLRKLRREKEK